MRKFRPTEAELEILQVLWKFAPCTVRFIHDKLKQKKQVRYTTTLKILQNMYEKKMVARDESSRSHLYQPLLKEGETQQLLLKRFTQTAFEGSAMKLVMQALGNHRASKEEISEIRRLLDKIEGDKK